MNKYILECNYCGNCMKMSKGTIKLQCGHRLCKNCVNNSTNVFCIKCNQTISVNSTLTKPHMLFNSETKKYTTSHKMMFIPQQTEETAKTNTLRRKRKYYETAQGALINKFTDGDQFDYMMMKLEANSINDIGIINRENIIYKSEENYHKKEMKYV